ncbi:uncharacterized protein LOC108155433 isoform X3 [Drosophila miranda]|uniref:uncharacterized protein LOC108155433 isoform X3 n=1 Tax=Drosophila miranda TaxID=7229 RepID=UPI00143F47DE|nr:uncharacterized protein LOC108155433 isoform X3 [Drosophila miranda]
MLLLLLAFIMRFVDISKRCAACSRAGIDCQHGSNIAHSDANGNAATAACWQHVATSNQSNSNSNSNSSSSTSSGCDSNSSSKENYYAPQQQQRQQQRQQRQHQQHLQQQQQHLGVTPQQLEQIRFYQRMQQQQLQLLQQQLMQRRRLQQQLRDQGVPAKQTTTTAGLTCNQQYLRQQRMQQQQQQMQQQQVQQQQRYLDNSNIDHDYLNNNINNRNSNPILGQGNLKLRRGMTEFSTNNDHKQPHFISASQQKPLQNSPIHQTNPRPHHHPQPLQRFAQQQQQYLQQTLPQGQQQNGNTAAHIGLGSSPHSPLGYRNPLNSPTGNTAGKRYQQQLTDRLLQQQHLQHCQQQQLQSLGGGGGSDEEYDTREELSEESLKQNVAIVLSNLDRYNNALRSLILNEQVSGGGGGLGGSSSLFLDSNSSSSLLFGCDNDTNQRCNNNNNNHNVWGKMAATPESDYNSNATTPGGRSGSDQQQQQLGVGATLCGGGGGIRDSNGGNCSLASSHDFTHDNSDYQWFLDYGYRDGCSGMQRSVLSSLSASYNAMGDLIYYEDLAKNLDANLAEVDMESFRAEDIHSLLSQLPAYCKSLGGANSRLQQSLLHQQQQQHLQQQQQQQQLEHSSNSNNMMMMMPHNMMSQTSTTSTNELIDNSFCKSELLFSPVRESHISVDSLDMDAYPDEGEIILTCNKDNYTIAFEGSVLYSDESFYEPNDMAMRRSKQNCINLHSNLEDIVKRNKALEVSMSRSAQAFQPLGPTMSPKGATGAAGATAKLQRYPSGNNNTETITITRHLPQCSVRKSSSLPNLQSEEAMPRPEQEEQQQQPQSQRVDQGAPLNVSQAISTSTMESCKSRSRNLLPMCQMPISISVSISERLQQQAELQQQQQQQQQQHRHKHHRCICSHESQNFCSGSVSSGNSSNPPAFNLVKLFIKQKSTSSGDEEPLMAQASAHTCMDVSSGCWPSSDAASSSSGSLEQRLRKKSMNDSGKGSAVSRHDEEEEEHHHYADQQTTPKQRQLRARSEAVFYDDAASSSSTGSLTATNSPAHRRRSMPLRNPQLYQLAAAQTSTASQMSSEASTEEQLTQVPRRAGAEAASTRPLSCASSSEMITRSMQTSCGSLSTTRSSLSERYRCVPPSFLEKLNNLGEQREAPIYVIYPNYALPDLGFVKTTAATPDVIFSPFNYKMTLDGAATSSGSLKKQRSSNSCSSRQSLNEDELLKTLDYKHIADWQSLATLLPVEYRRRLQHIPEVKQLVRQLDADLAQRPLFCMSPPLRRNRTHICDCAKYFQQTQTGHTQPLLDEGSSSGSSQPPSSGYRGSSTLLTDSELDADADPLKQMYVYQYDQQQHTTPPQPMPRSILRKANSAQARTKRNSMIEGGQQTQKMSKLEKRRSLQEPPYNYALGSTDELADVFEEEEHSQAQVQAPAVKQRLSRKDLDARARAENFLASLPRSELKYYAEIASILETSGEQVQYDAAALKKEVSRVLSQQKKVSFTDEAATLTAALAGDAKRFSTPPNSPNISMAAALQRRETLDVLEQRKIESNRFKRLQIQWELMSKDSSMLKELASEAATKSGGSTPTSTNSTGSNSATRSRIPRPVSYPAGRSSTPTSTPTAATAVASSPSTTPKTVTKSHNKTLSLLSSPRLNRLSSAQQDAANGSGKAGSSSTRSPSRIVQPKRYSLAGTPTHTPPAAVRPRTPTNRVTVTAPNTPKRQAGVAPSPRPTSRVR